MHRKCHAAKFPGGEISCGENNGVETVTRKKILAGNTSHGENYGQCIIVYMAERPVVGGP